MQTRIFVFLYAITFIQLSTCSTVATPQKIAAVQSHSVVANTGNSLKGTLVVSNCDKNSLSQAKETLSNQLTQNLQADPKNSNSKVTFNSDVVEASDGTYHLNYECHNVADQETAKNTLHTAVKQDNVQKTIAKCSKNDATSKQPSPSKTQQTKHTSAITVKHNATTKQTDTTKLTAPKSKTSSHTTVKSHSTTKVVSPETHATHTTETSKTHASKTARTDATHTAETSKTHATHTTGTHETHASKTGGTDATHASHTTGTHETHATKTVGTHATHASHTAGTHEIYSVTSHVSKGTQPKTHSRTTKSSEHSHKSTHQPRSFVSTKGTKVSGHPVTGKSVITTKRRQFTSRKGGCPCEVGKTRCEINCENGHNISSEGDKVVGVLTVNKCAGKQFSKNSSNLQAVTKQLTTLVNRELAKKGGNITYKVEFVKVIGNQSKTDFYYSINATKEHQDEIKAALRVVCKQKELRETIDKQQGRPCDGDSSSGLSESESESSSDSSEDSSSSEWSDESIEPTPKNEVAKHQSGRITRILSTSADIPYDRRGHYDSACGRCALSKISSTLLLEGVTLKEIASRYCGRFPQNFKYVLAAEVRKYQQVGLKSIEITTISTDAKQNLVVEFDVVVDPEYNQAIRDALRYAVVSLDLQRVFKYQQHY